MLEEVSNSLRERVSLCQEDANCISRLAGLVVATAYLGTKIIDPSFDDCGIYHTVGNASVFVAAGYMPGVVSRYFDKMMQNKNSVYSSRLEKSVKGI